MMVKLKYRLSAASRDPLARTTSLLIGDNIALAAIGAICTILTTHLWAPRDVGAVAAVVGAMGVIVGAANLGMPTMIVRFLGAELHQAALMKQALTATIALSAGSALLIGVVPGHLGLPVAQLGLNGWLLTVLLVAFAVASVVVAVGDPAWVARQEVSFMFGKDMLASAVRLTLLLVISSSSATSLFVVTLAYVGVSATADLGLLRLRLTRVVSGRVSPPFAALRRRFSFALSIQAANIVATIPVSTLPAVSAAIVGLKAGAYVAIPLQIVGLLTVVPSMTGQSLLAELSRNPAELIPTTFRALRAAYAVTLPVAAGLIVLAPYVLAIFGSRYATNGTSFLRFTAAGSLFFVLNYISDIVLVARRKMRAYLVVNMLGTLAQMCLIVVSLHQGLGWLGPAWLIGQALYATISMAVLLRYVSRDQLHEVALLVRDTFHGRPK